MTPVTDSDHLLGPADAPVVVVEYGNFECPNCKQVAPPLKQLVARHAGRIRLVYRHFPLEGVHAHALQAAEAAGAQGQFWAMHDMLYDNQLRLRSEDLRDYTARLGLDMKRYDRETLESVWLLKIKAQNCGRQAAFLIPCTTEVPCPPADSQGFPA